MEKIIENLPELSPMVWLIMLSAAIISISALFHKAIKFWLKLVIILVMAAFVIFFLRESGIQMIPVQ